jgi:hypothetical protein
MATIINNNKEKLLITKWERARMEKVEIQATGKKKDN